MRSFSVGMATLHRLSISFLAGLKNPMPLALAPKNAHPPTHPHFPSASFELTLFFKKSVSVEKSVKTRANLIFRQCCAVSRNFDFLYLCTYC